MPAPLKLGIIGDVHAEHHRLTLTLDYLYDQGINQIACTGDLSDGVGDLDETVENPHGSQCHYRCGQP